MKTILNSLDLQKNQIKNVVLDNRDFAPETPVEGQMYFDTTDDTLKIFNGTDWTLSHSSLAEFTDDPEHRLVTDAEKELWNSKGSFSGDYNDLANKPTIPSNLTDLSDDSNHRTVTDSQISSWTGKADLASPDLTGIPKAPTASAGTNTRQVATTAFVKTAVDNAKVSPEFTGIPLAPTATVGTSNQQIATTAFVKLAIDNAILTAINETGY